MENSNTVEKREEAAMGDMSGTATTSVLHVQQLYNSSSSGVGSDVPYVLSPEDNATMLRLIEAGQGIHSSYIWVIFVLGFPANVACVVTVLSMTTLSTATLYVALLAVMDALTLVFKLVFHQMAYHRVYFGDLGCKLITISYILNCYANWVLVLVCFERFLAVSWPLKKAVFFTKSRAYLIAVVLFGIIFLIYLQLFVLHISDPTGYKCGFNSDVGTYIKVWYWFAAILFSFAPFILIVIFTWFIITGLRKYRAARKSILRSDQHHHHHHHHQQHNGKAKGDKRGGENTTSVECAISVMMTVAAVVFLVLTLPNCILLLSYDRWRMYPPVENARWLLFEQVAYMLQDFNHAINFYLYFLTADKFRTQFRELLMCRRRRGMRKKSDANSTVDHTMYTRANSTENLAMTRV
ncbi:thyrotropin-releasing hormone receptor-like [Littorina saxatilis]|uniref:thyrotropin-releasing hormone receptor-like n=1 Tax=Littorina saxatilis TaxID=31220 RepID=UPI0038B52F92